MGALTGFRCDRLVDIDPPSGRCESDGHGDSSTEKDRPPTSSIHQKPSGIRSCSFRLRDGSRRDR